LREKNKENGTSEEKIKRRNNEYRRLNIEKKRSSVRE